MHLKSLTLKGFKSFADRSLLQLEPGVTVIVGPNGSGKSNVSDAVLWVLGEQSAKQLRGNSMEDVIFAGSSAKQPVGVAEVDLVLDNSDGTLPLEFTEVTITRRMYRSGESEYLINSTPCRLMDVYDLLHDTGLGRDTHSIISQGRLDEVLNSRPEDRRALIEEAAGVLKHKKRKERALRKLTSMDTNLERARDVLGEVERQLRPLQRQADKAREHQQLAEELTELEVSLAVESLRELQGEWAELEKREREQDADIELARMRVTEKERELQKFQSLLEEKGLFVGDLGEQRRRLQGILERLNSGLLLLEEKGKNLVEKLSELRTKIHQSRSRQGRRGEEHEALVKERTASEGQLKGLYTRLGELRRESETARKDRMAAEEELTAVNTAIRRTRKEVDDARAELGGIEQALSAFRLEEELLAERAETIGSQRHTLVTTLAARRSRLDAIEQSRAHTLKQIALADADVDKRLRVMESRRKDLDEVREQLGAVRAEVRGLEEVDRAFDNATPALAWVLSSEERLDGVIGPLTDHISVEPDLEHAVENALGSDLFCVLTKDRRSATDLLALLKDNDAGDISLVALDSVVAPQTDSAPGRRVIDAIGAKAAIRPALEALIGDVYYVPSLPEALDAIGRASGARFVTGDGYLVWPSGKITMGPAVDGSSSVLARKRRINALKDDEQAAQSRTGESESVLVDAEEAVSAAQQDALELGQRLAALTGEAESVREEVGRLEATLTDAETEKTRIEQRIALIGDKTAKDRPARERTAAKITDLGAEVERLEDEAVTKREIRDNKARDEAAIGERLSSCQVDMATVSEREVHLKRQMGSASAEMEELADALAQAEAAEEAFELLRERIQPVHDLYAGLLERAEFWAVRLRDRARFEQTDSASLRDTIHDAQEAVRTAQLGVEERNEGMAEIRVLKGQLEVQVTAAVSRIVDEYDMPVERALELPPVEDRDRAQEAAHRLRKKLGSIGPVNAVAAQEFTALDERRTFLTEQIQDLSSSRTALQKVVRAIDRKMRDRFLETFEQVNGHFQDVFALLFPGGTAELRMTDPDDLEETGIEVVAQPAGKKLQKMTLMSGGERSCTALALLFALYRTRPCPFYILDEVEAALDDSNLRRFVGLVDTLRNHTQFIVVTHQRRTMEMADVLYGVSMQADGVSKVVSQKLDRASGGETADEPVLA